MFNSIINGNLTITNVLICVLVSLICGLIISYIYKKTSKCSNNFSLSLIILPILVQIVIMMTNGNLGTSVAVLGAFSLIRFRSVPGNSKEIIGIFFAMAIGLATGIGQIFFALLLTIIISIVIYIITKFNVNKNNKVLRIIVPEDLDYDNIFDDIFKKHSVNYELISIKTTNLGTLFELKYNISLNNNDCKKLIDDLRVKNGNMKILIFSLLEDSEL